jgi:deazaflavin-dependent oxidoreductase (nitroreductase family)
LNPLKLAIRNPTAYRLLIKRRALIAWTERALRAVSNDRIGALDLVGLPSIRLTVAGRKTGVLRTTPLQYVPDGEVLLLVGSNWGGHTHPAWSANLMAAQRATVRRRGEQFTASARMLTGAERSQAWSKALHFWPNYQIAQHLAGGREFRIFALKRIR